MIDDVARAAGAPCVVHRSAVGETHVVDLMHKVGAHLGGEGNGGVIDPRVVYVRDSIGSIGLVLQLLAEEGKPVSQIVDELPRYAIVKHKFDCTRDRTARILDKVRAEFAKERIIDVDGVRIDQPEGWVHVRGSNTEPIMRIIAEAADEQAAHALVARVQSIADGVA
jgi:phosphomannomutase